MAAWARMLGRKDGAAQRLRRDPAFRTAVRHGGFFLLGTAMGAGRLFSGCGPFGAAAVAAAGGDWQGLFCLVGAVFGCVLSAGFFSGIRYIATAVMVYTVGLAARGKKLQRSRWFLPLTAAVFTGVTGALSAWRTVGGIPGVLRLFLEVVLAGGCAFMFSFTLAPEKTAGEAAALRRSISAAVTAACGFMGLASIEIWGVLGVGRFFAILAVMAAGFCGGPLAGCAAGTAMGLGMDLAGSAGLFFTAAYGLAGLLAGALYRYGRLTFTVAFCAGNAVTVLLGWSGGAHISALYECFAASVVFVLLPQSALTPVGSLLRVGRGQGETAFRLYQAERLDQLARGFESLHAAAAAEPGDQSGATEAAAVFDRAADVVCRVCENRGACWKKDYEENVRALASMADGMVRRGSIGVKDLPIAFRQRCTAPGAFAGAVNGELRGLLYQRQYRARLRESRAAAYGQFSDMAEVLGDAARQLSGAAGPDTEAERRLIRFLKNRELDGVCAVFRDGRGRVHATLEGAGVENIVLEPDYLEKLSEAAGVRLCRLGPQEKGRVVLRQAEPLAASVGIAAMKKEGEEVSGDRETYFKTDAGLLCVILSDGMGTGPAAAGESGRTVEILTGLLKAGMEPGCAMRLLNSAAMLRNGDAWGYATVDLCCIDLFTGETCFYKYGAAPSYVKTGRTVRRVRGASLAAGMLAGEESVPDRIRMSLRPGHVALIASDGVLAENGDKWIRDILAASDGTDVKDLARAVLRAAAERFGNADDMTALAIRVEERQ